MDSRLPCKTFNFARNDDFLLDSSFSGLPRLLAKSRNDEVKNHKNTKSKQCLKSVIFAFFGLASPAVAIDISSGRCGDGSISTLGDCMIISSPTDLIDIKGNNSGINLDISSNATGGLKVESNVSLGTLTINGSLSNSGTFSQIAANAGGNASIYLNGRINTIINNGVIGDASKLTGQASDYAYAIYMTSNSSIIR